MPAAMLAAVVAIAVAAWLAWPNAATPEPTPQTVRPLPLRLPAAGSATAPVAAGLPASVGQDANGPRSSAASAPAQRVIGSEGYGPHIDQAHAGADPLAAWEAARWLMDFASNETLRASLQGFRDQGLAPAAITRRMVELDAEARRCQTVTAAHQALLPELAARAMQAGVPGAAATYAEAARPNSLTLEQRREVADALRRDAWAGDAPSLLGAAFSNEAWGLSDAERLSFLLAYAGMPDPVFDTDNAIALEGQGALKLRSAPTAQQWEAARQTARELLARAGVDRRP